MLAPFGLSCLELSALRVAEVLPLVDALPALNLTGYSYVSLHAPSNFVHSEEAWLADFLFERVPKAWPIVMHPDAIFDFGCWKRFGSRLAIENMDRRKPCGRSNSELQLIFDKLPEASFCFDIGHARQFDSSMTEAFLLLTEFRDRLIEVHASEVNSESQHDPISYGAKLAFQQVADIIGEPVPIILESRVDEAGIAMEIRTIEEGLTAGDRKPKSEEMKNIFDGLGTLVQSLSAI